MAVDEAVLEHCGRGDVPPTLRLYAWNPPCLSLGYAQPLSDADLPRLKKRGWDAVRRLTGGRAILHADELTYAVIAPPEEPLLAGSVLESYRRISAALLAALMTLGIPAEALPKPQGAEAVPKQAQPVCFERPSDYEITVHGRKLVGSAQARKKSGILQHGSIPLHGDLTRITQVLAFPDEPARQEAAVRLLARATTVEAALGRRIPWEEAAESLARAFQETLGVQLEPGELTPSEAARAAELVRQKYAHPDWIARM
jgi:lipoate-protein ligase A